jgi:PBP1b-binding outer membrane lipoprotein LpoB
MEMKNNIFSALMLTLVLTACNQQNMAGSGEVAQTKESTFPAVTIDQMLEMNQNERSELAQRCQGIKNTTCSDFNGETFKQRDELAKTFCHMAEEQRLSKGVANAVPRTRKCSVYY